VSFTSKINFKKLDLDLQKLGKKLKMGVSTHSETNSQKNIQLKTKYLTVKFLKFIHRVRLFLVIYIQY